jgi:hypothetical protein
MSTSYKQAAQELTRCNLGKVFEMASGDKLLLKLYRELANLNGLHHKLNEYLCLLGYQITGIDAGGDPVKMANIRNQSTVLYEKIKELESQIMEVKSLINESERRVTAKPAEVAVEVAAEVVAEVVVKPTKRKAPQPKGHIEAGFVAWNSKKMKQLRHLAGKSQNPTYKETRKQ